MHKLFAILFIAGFIFSCKTQEDSTDNRRKVNVNVTPLNVKIYENDGDGLGPCEPSIFVSPTNPDIMIAGSIIDYVHTSKDAGKSWQTKRLESSLGVWGDPVIVADSNGNFYYLHLSDPEGTNWASDKILDRIVIQRTEDNGKTWNDGSSIGLNPPKQQDKEWAVVNPINNEIYVTWTEFDDYGSRAPDCKSRILFSKSADKGETWSTPITLSQFEGNCVDDDNTTEGAVPAVDNEGNIYVSWSYNNTLWLDKSLDGGTTWLENDIEVVPQEAGWTFKVPALNRTNGMPVTVVDNSNGEHSGTIYINYADQMEDGDTDVFLIKSIDQGVTWSTSKRVNNDTTKTDQFLTWMSIDQSSGFIYIVYYDRSKYTDTQTDVVLATSKDGGQSFTHQTISESSFDPTGCPFFGDYNNIHASNGIVRPIWTRWENNKLSIWTAVVEEN